MRKKRRRMQLHMVNNSDIKIVKQYYANSKEEGWVFDWTTCVTDIAGSSVTPDTEKYLTTTIYLHDFYKDIIFSVLAEETKEQ